ncbi:MAG: PatB family C-S lyase [Bacteroidales bacterium]|nr:PatB family C-S lyase [Bacteroidales bacterium]
MKYNFDCEIIRRGTDCVKWDEAAEGEIPMWVADMDFETAPCIKEAIIQRARHGVYGYNFIPESFYEAIIWWNSHRHGWTPRREWILYTSGVVPAFSAIIQGLVRADERVLFFTPAYNCFFSSVRNNGSQAIEFPLTWQPENETYVIDFEALEEVMRSQRPRLFLFCNPHNPTGRVWTLDELRHVAELCHRYDIILLSDEIHCEFVDPLLGRRYLPFAPIAEECGCKWVIANAPNKAFNIAGLMTAYIVTPDDDLRQRIDRAININEICDINCFSFVALQAAYTPEGEAWLDQLVDYIYENYRLFRSTMKEAFPHLPIAHLEGTYLAWMDVTAFPLTSDEISARLRQTHKVWINGGEMYGQQGFMRVNLATQRSRVIEGTHRIINGLLPLLR